MRTLSPFVFLCAVSTIQSSTSFSQTPTPFPKDFSIDFVTNITDDNKQYPIDGTLYYSWSSRSQRIDHAPGSYECIHFYNSTSSCTLVFLPTGGMYRVLGDGDCCLDLAHIGTPPPDWAARANPTFVGKVHDGYSNLDTLEWIFDNLTAAFTSTTRPAAHHTTRQVAPGHHPLAGIPVLFTFPGNANGRQDYHFNVTSMIVGQQDPSLFRLDEPCKNVPCPPQPEIPTRTTWHIFYIL